MTRKQLTALCLCFVVMFIAIGSLVGMLPVYMPQLGADASVTGFSMSLGFLSLALSSVTGGWLSNRFQRRKFFLILGGVLAVPVVWLASQTTTLVLFTILMTTFWFITGIALAMVNILIGLFSEAGNRGRIFGILNLSLGIGVFLGNLISGPVVDRWGFPTLLMLVGALYLIIPVAGLFVQDKEVVRSQTSTASPGIRAVFSHRTFFLLFTGAVLAQAANSLMILSRPLIMNALDYNASAIAGVSAVGTLITLPLPLIAGRISDRFGRKPVLIFCVLTTTVALILQILAVDLWHFSIVSAFQSILAVSLVAGSALVTDIFPEESLGTALSLFNTTPSLGILIGLSAGGLAIRTFEMLPTVLFTVLLSLVAVVLLTPIPAEKPKIQPEASFG